MGDKDIHCQIAHDNIFRVPTSSGNHGKPGKSRKKSMHGKIIKFEKKNPELSWKNHGIL